MSDINLLPEEKRKEETKKRPKKSEIEMTEPLRPFVEKERSSKEEKLSPKFFDTLKKLWTRIKSGLEPETSKIIKEPKPFIKKSKKVRPAMIVSEKISSGETWGKRFFSRFFKKGIFPSAKAKVVEAKKIIEGKSSYSPLIKGARGLSYTKAWKEPSTEMEVNLLPEEIAAAESAKKQKVILISAITASFLLVIFLYLGFFLYRSRIVAEIKEKNSEILELNKEITEYEKKEKEPQGLRERINVIDNLLKKHIYWTKFFALLEKHTIPEVSYLGFSAKEGEKITLQATAKDYNALAKQFVAFQEAEDFVKDVSITSASLQSGKEGEESVVSFSVTLELQPGVFVKMNQEL